MRTAGRFNRESYGGITFVDPGNQAGTNNPIIPIEARTVGTAQTGLTDLFAYRVGLDGFHGVSTVGGQIVQTWLPDFSTAGAVKKGEVELGPGWLRFEGHQGCVGVPQHQGSVVGDREDPP